MCPIGGMLALDVFGVSPRPPIIPIPGDADGAGGLDVGGSIATFDERKTLPPAMLPAPVMLTD